LLSRAVAAVAWLTLVVVVVVVVAAF